MKTEKEVIRMKNGCQRANRNIAKEIGMMDPGLSGYEQALHWVLMPSCGEKTKKCMKK